ncbi:enoyl-CoA hydratase [Chitinimonas koreensis]|uniref:enoyl-CoA hydratase n=1 Tax=Chitinimonas koreensis TaxID=356302 RepID=UPI0003F992FA|nr:enoyl-CoA hydratase [Chitinimonas koreensis]
MSEQLHYERIGHTALVTIQNPPANTWTEDSLPALKALVESLDADREIYALVLTGQGPKFFSAGADLNVFADGDKARARRMITYFGQAFETLARFRGVSIAAINGYAMGGGLEAAMACDIRIAEEHAVMALPEASVGLLPGGLGTQHLPWLIGEGWAKRMILCGERIDAPTALRIGLVEEVVPAGTARDKALALAEKVAKQSPSSVAACKQLIQAARSQPMWSALPLEREKFVDLFDTEDQREGVAAFLEKRAPSWKNR